ncbi:hypothetical protein COU13_00725 [Candidatus Kaiserbacteria bacterium CG10_big_fil_rev_8_21_14_0_10_43_70]|uniref:Uncharacterized protein n=1 Tax=Candidatus Kaiserbacteria bacterium CG10_big_fil_rev_8_21_14_0_10_43_70 TaxID=1974605 RepID=A0A2H0UJ99_9BACT|nr:MAG: hypothetical protein COU13_00725 [Candidatus Kaiserbacteria bacterium CG10_big_fil_rev_8_21_14_0_10_43_70]
MKNSSIRLSSVAIVFVCTLFVIGGMPFITPNAYAMGIIGDDYAWDNYGGDDSYGWDGYGGFDNYAWDNYGGDDSYGWYDEPNYFANEWYEPDYLVNEWYEPDYLINDWYEPDYLVNEWYEPDYLINDWYEPDYFYPEYGYYDEYYEPFYGYSSFSTPSFGFGGGGSGKSSSNSNSGSKSSSNSSASAVANSSSSSVNNNTNVNNNTVNNTIVTKVTDKQPTIQQPFHPTPNCTLFANPSSVASGGNTTLIWSSSNATSASLSGFGSVQTSGSRVVSNLQSTQTYTLTVNGQGGTNTCSTTVGVHSNPTPTPTPFCTITVNPSFINNSYGYGNQSATLSWTSSNATSAHINNIGQVSTSGSRTVNPGASTTYTMTVNGQGGSNTCTAHLTVGNTQPPVIPPVVPPVVPPVGNLYCSIQSNPNNIQNGAGSVLSWTSTGAVSAWISDGIGPVNVNGTLTVRPEASRNYTLTISNGYGQTQNCSTHVNVHGQYISLTQIPYTGFDFGPVGNTIYWLSLIGLSLGAGYVFVRYRGNILDLAFSAVGVQRLSAVDRAEVIHEAVVLEDTQVEESEETEEESTTDYSTARITLKDGDENNMPRITING